MHQTSLHSKICKGRIRILWKIVIISSKAISYTCVCVYLYVFTCLDKNISKTDFFKTPNDSFFVCVCVKILLFICSINSVKKEFVDYKKKNSVG